MIMSLKTLVLDFLQSDNIVVLAGVYKLVKMLFTSQCVKIKRWVAGKLGSWSPFSVRSINLRAPTYDDKMATREYMKQTVGHLTSWFSFAAIESFASVIGKPITLLLDLGAGVPMLEGLLSMLKTVLTDVEEIVGGTAERVCGRMFLFTKTVVFEEWFGLDMILECIRAQPVEWIVHVDKTMPPTETLTAEQLPLLWNTIQGVPIFERVPMSANISDVLDAEWIAERLPECFT